MCAAPQLLARGQSHGVGTVDDLRETERFAAARIVAGTHVAVAAGLRERFSAEEDSRPLDEAFIDRTGQPGVGARGVAHAREAALQRAFEQRPGSMRAQRGRGCVDLANGTAGRIRVEMRVDQTRHDEAAACVDEPYVRNVEFLRRDLDDFALAHQNVAVRQRGLDAVEDSAVPQEQAGGRVRRRFSIQ